MRLARMVGVVAMLSSVVLAQMAGTAVDAVASGGGGCGRPVTDDVGSRIVIRNFCFGPTIARVRPGTTVTFVNRDGFPHTVLGANGSWGSFGRIGGGHHALYRFTRPGVYPYVCTYHPGMVGAVVVGRGVPRTRSITTTGSGPVVQLATNQDADAVAGSGRVAPPAQRTTSVGTPARSWPALVGAMVALFVVSAGLLVYGRRRRRTIVA
jgi:plastocyanin